ncbi:hypothetical protein BGZ67_010319 [Mortierella alpina]|nr:hypothetical protein BGZ67_010319 [Mortierella alpina]
MVLKSAAGCLCEPDDHPLEDAALPSEELCDVLFHKDKPDIPHDVLKNICDNLYSNASNQLDKSDGDGDLHGDDDKQHTPSAADVPTSDSDGKVEGNKEGNKEGNEDVNEDVNEEGIEEGNEDVNEEGNEDVNEEGIEEGNGAGIEEGNEEGHEEGNEEGNEESNGEDSQDGNTGPTSFGALNKRPADDDGKVDVKGYCQCGLLVISR